MQNSITDAQWSSLEGALESNDLAAFLMQAIRVPPGASNKSGWNPSHLAAFRDIPGLLPDLAVMGHDPAACSNKQASALMLAVQGGAARALRYLLDEGVDATTADRSGMTPLHHAAWVGRPACVRLLLSAGVPVDPLDSRHMSPLHMAIRGDHAEVVALLLDRGANPDIKAPGCRDAMDLARTSGSVDVMPILVSWFEFHCFDHQVPLVFGDRPSSRL